MSSTGRRISKVLSLADHVLSCSRAGGVQLLEYGVPTKKAGSFSYWVDQKIFVPHSTRVAREHHGLPQDQTICLFVGRLIQVKGVEIVFSLAERRPDIFFLTAGDGPLEANCLSKSKTLPNFRHFGCMENYQLPSLYSACDLLLVPSLFTEGIPRVICEALSCGLPVIASNLGGLKEVVKNGVGILVEPATEAFAAAISAWRDRGGTTPEIRQNCRIHAENQFSSANARVIEDSLRELAKK